MSIFAFLATAFSRYVLMLRVSPGRWRASSEFLKQRLSAFIIHLVVDSVVSTAAVSLRARSIFASESRNPLISATSLSRSIPLDASQSSSIRPFILTSLMKPFVLTLAFCIESSLITTRFCNNGRNFMSTVRCPKSAMVSFTCGSESFW